MAWMTAGETPTAAKMNETAPGVATATGRLIVTDGANSIAERVPTAGYVGTSQSTTSTSFTDLTTSGPSVTVTTGTAALVIISATLQNSNAGSTSYIGVDVSGASTIAAAQTKALILESAIADQPVQCSYVYLETGLTAGSNTFKLEYQVSGSTGTFLRRRLIVVPL